MLFCQITFNRKELWNLRRAGVYHPGAVFPYKVYVFSVLVLVSIEFEKGGFVTHVHFLEQIQPGQEVRRSIHCSQTDGLFFPLQSVMDINGVHMSSLRFQEVRNPLLLSS